VTANGVEVLDALRRQSYDMVFMDIQMPEMDGLEATRRIREEFPPERQPVIVAVTANALDGDRDVCLKAGMQDYMSKPIRVDMVQKAIERWAGETPQRGNSPVSDTADALPATDTQPDSDRASGTHASPASDTSTDADASEMLDPDTVEMLRAMASSNQSGMLEELIDILESQSADLINEITEALSRNDAKTVQRAAHTLKGSALNLGAKMLADAYFAVEIAADEERLDDIPGSLAEARSVFERTLPVLRATYRRTTSQ